MSLLVVGSVALDSVETPFGKVREVLGGSATYFSVAASYFTEVQLVAVVGEDFPQEHIELLKTAKVDISGLQKEPGRTFRWEGEYGFQLNEAKTLNTELNVFETFKPQLADHLKSPDLVFLANIDPGLQREVLHQVKRPLVVACDTMNFWISGRREALLATLKEVDVVIINDGEARELAGEVNLIKAAQLILQLGPRTLIIKRGEYGVLLFSGHTIFAAPAYPMESVFDPTGAGDSFAGGFMGYLARLLAKGHLKSKQSAAGPFSLDEEALRSAVVIGSVMASFNVESFSLDRLRGLTWSEIKKRFQEFQKMTTFGDLI